MGKTTAGLDSWRWRVIRKAEVWRRAKGSKAQERVEAEDQGHRRHQVGLGFWGEGEEGKKERRQDKTDKGNKEPWISRKDSGVAFREAEAGEDKSPSNFPR